MHRFGVGPLVGFLLLCASCTFLTTVDGSAYQESAFCTDGLDNDGDNLVDCADGDCAANESCLFDAGSPDAFSCKPTISFEECEESDVECETTSDFYSPTDCDPVDQCDCPEDRVCYPTYDTRGATSTECSSDVGAGIITNACSDHHDCAPGYFCLVELFDPPECVPACDDPCDCQADQVCLRYYPPFCAPASRPCRPLSDDCEDGEACVFQPDITGNSWITICMNAGLMESADECQFPSDCVAHSLCWNHEGTSACREYCDESHVCDTGTCQAVGSISGCDVPVSLCLP